MLIGVGYRRQLDAWIDSAPCDVQCLEITAEHFFGHAEYRLRVLGARYPLFVHGLGLSLGTPGPLNRDRLGRFARVAEIGNAKWVSEHVAFTRTEESDLGHLNPVRLTRENVDLIAQHAREVSDHCGRPLVLENITSHLRLDGDLSEPDFLNAICDKADCGLLLDVTNLFINSRNHGFDPIAWLDALDTSRIRQLHIVGYSRHGDVYSDDHAIEIQPELIELAREVIARASVQAVVLERDEGIPEDPSALDSELAKLRDLF